MFLVSFFVAIGTFKGIAGLGPQSTIGLWIVQLLFPVICVGIYVLSQIVLVLRTLDDRWPLGDIIFGTGFYVVGLVLMFGFSADICEGVKHYIDGTFFGVLCMLLSVMMVYKCEQASASLADTPCSHHSSPDRLGLYHQGRPRVLCWQVSTPDSNERA